MFEIAKARAAPVFLDRNAEQAKLAHFGQQMPREDVRPVDLRRQRRDLFLGKSLHRIADHVRGFAKVEVQCGISVRDHGACLAGCAPAANA